MRLRRFPVVSGYSKRKRFQWFSGVFCETSEKIKKAQSGSKEYDSWAF